MCVCVCAIRERVTAQVFLRALPSAQKHTQMATRGGHFRISKLLRFVLFSFFSRSFLSSSAPFVIPA